MLETSRSDSQIREGTGETVSASRGRENIFGTFGDATEYFAADQYRPFQREVIEEIESAYEQGYRHVLVDAPTGSGKSHIARAFAFQSGNAHIITVQKLLQDQYRRDFSDMFVMKGRGAYVCLLGEGNESCADGPCQLRRSAPCADCPYRIAKYAAALAPVTVHNFDSFYYQNAFGSGYPGRKLLVVDECHNIPQKFSSFLSFTISSRGGIEVPEATRIGDYDAFVKSAYDEYSNELSALNGLYDADGLSAGDLRRMRELSQVVHSMKRYLVERSKPSPSEYVFDYTATGRYAPSVTFRPVHVGDFASKWLYNYGERTLMMSATILDKEMFCWEAGLDPDSVYFVEVPSTFPPENRPIFKKYAGKMSYANIDATLPRIVDVVDEIVSKFPDRKGIIQTHSDKIAEYLRMNLDDARYTFNRDYDSPQQMLEVHVRKPGSVIVASGLREGIDLHGDLSKFQIFCKIPYPSLGDKVVKRKMELNDAWYGWATSTMFVQALGRSVRSSRERAVTYILDSGFGWFYTKNKRYIPEYIREAIVW